MDGEIERPIQNLQVAFTLSDKIVSSSSLPPLFFLFPKVEELCGIKKKHISPPFFFSSFCPLLLRRYPPYFHPTTAISEKKNATNEKKKMQRIVQICT